MDPSTNFVRSHVNSPNQIAKAFGSSDDSTTDDNDSQKRNTFEKDVGVHYAYAAYSFVFDFAIQAHAPYRDYKESLIEEPLTSIFQPPKIA